MRLSGANGADLDGAVENAVGWDRLAASIAEANKLARPDKAYPPALATLAYGGGGQRWL